MPVESTKNPACGGMKPCNILNYCRVMWIFLVYYFHTFRSKLHILLRTFEVNDKDSISFQLADWATGLKLKLLSSENNKDSAVFTAQNDSTSLRLVVFPYFCSDGMSDMIYKNRIRLQYNNKVYTGCGVNFN